MSRVYRSICDLISNDNLYFDTNSLIGRVAIVEIRNQRGYNGVIYSYVDRFEVLSETDEELIIEMLKTMIKYYDGKYE